MADEFKSNIGSKVTKTMAREWIDKYDRERRQNKETDTQSVFYGKDALMDILAKGGCTGISFFFALKPDQSGVETVQLVLVGTREDGSLMWPEDSGNSAYEFGTPCPPYCAQ
jgi:hypothetical protein